MSLFNNIMNAVGTDNANYLKGGRHVGRLRRVELRDPSERTGPEADMKPGFKFDIEVLFSNRADFNTDAEGAARRGDIRRATDPFRYPSKALARARKLAAVAATSKTGKQVSEATLGLERKEGEDDKAFAARYGAEVKRLFGPDQPLTGAVITVVITEGKNKETGKPYSLFEVEFPSEDDLKNAGLI